MLTSASARKERAIRLATILANTLEADPIWQLPESEFRQLAGQGSVPADPRTPPQVIEAIIDGSKPASQVAAWVPGDPVGVESQAERAIAGGLLAFYSHLGGNRRSVTIARTYAAAVPVRFGLLLPAPMQHVVLGRAFGYSEADICAGVDIRAREFGSTGRMRGEKLIKQMAFHILTTDLKVAEGLFSKGWSPYRPLTPGERAGGPLAPPRPCSLESEMALHLEAPLQGPTR